MIKKKIDEAILKGAKQIVFWEVVMILGLLSARKNTLRLNFLNWIEELREKPSWI